MADKMWANFKTIFAEEYYDLLEETRVNIWDAGFHSENAMQKIREGTRTPSHGSRGQQGHCCQFNIGGGATNEEQCGTHNTIQ